MTYALGKLPKKNDPRTLRLADYLAPTAPPASVDWGKRVPTWGNLGNDRVGDCTCAAAGHAIQEWTYDAAGTEAAVTDRQVLAAYSAVTGYNPADPSTDQGAMCLDVLNYWRTTGIGGHRIAAFAEASVANHVEIKAAIAEFGVVYIGAAMPTSAERETNAGKTWAAVTDSPGSWGGHCVAVVGYNSRGLTCITWGRRQRMTWRWWDRYADEAYAVLSTDWLTAKGTAPSGVNLARLQADLAAVTGSGPLAAPRRRRRRRRRRPNKRL